MYPLKMDQPATGGDNMDTASESNAVDEVEDGDGKPESLKDNIAFFVFGFLLYAIYSLIISGAQDILMGTLVPTSAVLVVNIGPYFLVSLIAPYFIRRISYFSRVIAVFLLEAVGLITVVVGKQLSVKLFGVALCSFAFGLGELSFVAMTSFYHEAAINAFSCGTGFGIAFAPLYYTAMTTWWCISPGVTIIIVATSLVFLLVFYGLMDRKHSQPENQPSTHKDVTYTAMDNNAETRAAHVLLTWREKLTGVKRVWHVAMSIFIAWISEYLVIQAVLTTIAFPNAPFPPRDHYQYYVCVFLFGELFGRSYLAMLSFIKPILVEKAVCSRIWLLMTAEVFIFIFLLLAAWFRFLPDVWTVLLFALMAGVVCGAMYTNMLVLFSRVEDPNIREFVLGYAMVATAAGATIAAFLGLVIEPWLRHHCISELNAGEFCYTRKMEGSVCG